MTSREGDCFEVALKVAIELRSVNPSGQLWITHGLPIGRGPDNNGKRYWHAWVECVPDRTMPLVMCIDRSNGLDLAMPKGQYYAAGQLSRDWVWRFTLPEANHSSVMLGHAGPWIYGHSLLDETRRP